MKANEFVAKLKDIAENHKTLYVMGCIGAPLTSKYASRYLTNYAYNKQPARTAMIKAATDTNPVTFGFDCVCLVKSVLWGWNGDTEKPYGGATYQANSVPDIDCNVMIERCTDVSSDFRSIQIGELLWMSGHVGVYIGNGLAVECTPIWNNGTQITAVGNIGKKSGYNSRTWTKHGKLPYVEYEKEAQQTVKIELPVLQNTSNGNDAIHDEPITDELSGETFIHSPEEAQNFIVRLLNHIISFIMKLFKK